MEQYVSKSALVAELKKRIDEHNSLANAAADNNLHNTLEANELLIRNYKNLISFINALEVKDVQEPTASDKGMAEEIIINLKRVEQDYHIDLTKEMEWLRSKVKKGENV